MNIVKIAHDILRLEGIYTFEDENDIIEEKFQEYFGLRLDELEYLIELYEKTKFKNHYEKNKF